MELNFSHILKTIVITIVVTMVFSCESNFKEVQKIGVLQNQPIGEATNINLKYTEFLLVKAYTSNQSPLFFILSSNLEFG